MKTLLEHLRISLVSTLVLAVILCGVYPLVVWGIAQAFFPDQANGSLVYRGRTVVGSALIGQDFKEPAYFHPRPSAAGKGYDAASSGGSNFGPISKAFLEAVAERVKVYRLENGLPEDLQVPADAVTASASGLDPHVSIQNAILQVPRVARARRLDEETVLRLVREHTEGPDLGIFGETRVNVLLLNLDLDRKEVSK